MTTNTTSWIKPSQFLRDNKMKVKVGDVLDPASLGMATHPTFGALPVLTVTEADEDGRLLAGTIVCAEDPSEVVHVKAGDWFQVRRCRTHQKRLQRKNSRSKLSPEVKEAREAERAAAKAARDQKKAEEKAAKAAKRAEEEKARIEKKLAEQKAAAEKKLADAQQKVEQLQAKAPTPDAKTAVNA
jgi:flagellar biosynthesis GTPase FlhF